MLADNFQNNKRQEVKSDFTSDGKIISVLDFLELHLPKFSENYQKNDKEDEWNLNEELFAFLDIYSRDYAFQFIPEYRYKNKSRPDFGIKEVKTDEAGIYTYDKKAEHFFDIECKRLYHPTISKKYVSGKTGGIQRFKENRHGVNLPYSAMIGYVEIENFKFWHKKVNSWISIKEEHLKFEVNKIANVEINKMAKLKSTHIRNIENTKIELTHFWVNIN